MNPLLGHAARILLAALFVISGTRKILAFGFVSGMMAQKGFPIADVFLVATIVVEIAGGLMLVANWNAKYAALTLAAFTLATAAIFHGFWNFWGAPLPEFNNQLNHFLKNVAIAGGLLLVATLPKAVEARN